MCIESNNFHSLVDFGHVTFIKIRCRKQIVSTNETYYRHCATILANVIFASFEILNKNCFISLFMMTFAILNIIT